MKKYNDKLMKSLNGLLDHISSERAIFFVEYTDEEEKTVFLRIPREFVETIMHIKGNLERVNLAKKYPSPGRIAK